jgi:hypothetical protein
MFLTEPETDRSNGLKWRKSERGSLVCIKLQVLVYKKCVIGRLSVLKISCIEEDPPPEDLICFFQFVVDQFPVFLKITGNSVVSFPTTSSDNTRQNPPTERVNQNAQNWSAVLLPVPAPPVVPPMTTRGNTTAPPHGDSLARRDNELHVIYKIDGKPKIDGNFFKSMAKAIKDNRGSIADAYTPHCGYYTSSSCSENAPVQH